MEVYGVGLVNVDHSASHYNWDWVEDSGRAYDVNMIIIVLIII